MSDRYTEKIPDMQCFGIIQDCSFPHSQMSAEDCIGPRLAQSAMLYSFKDILYINFIKNDYIKKINTLSACKAGNADSADSFFKNKFSSFLRFFLILADCLVKKSSVHSELRCGKSKAASQKFPVPDAGFSEFQFCLSGIG